MEIGMVDRCLIYAIRKVKPCGIKKIQISLRIPQHEQVKIHFRQDLNQIEWGTVLSPHSDGPVNTAATFQEIFESLLHSNALVRKNS